jgi:hypothetical protein
MRLLDFLRQNFDTRKSMYCLEREPIFWQIALIEKVEFITLSNRRAFINEDWCGTSI